VKLSRRELLKKMETMTGVGVVLSSELLARLSSTVSVTASKEIRPDPPESVCPVIFYAGCSVADQTLKAR
jgi:hypothetical protein